MLRVLLAVMVAMMFGLAGCEKKETPGDQLDKAIESAEKTAEETQEEAKDVAEQAEKTVEEAKEVPQTPAQ